MINDISISYRKYIMKWMEKQQKIGSWFCFSEQQKKAYFFDIFGKVHFL